MREGRVGMTGEGCGSGRVPVTDRDGGVAPMVASRALSTAAAAVVIAAAAAARRCHAPQQ